MIEASTARERASRVDELLPQGSWSVQTATLDAATEALTADLERLRAWAEDLHTKRREAHGARSRHGLAAARVLLRSIFESASEGSADPSAPLAEVNERLLATLKALSKLLVHLSPEIALTAAVAAARLQSRASNLHLEAQVDALSAQVSQLRASHHGSAPAATKPGRGIVLLGAAAIGEQLGLTEATVYQRERKRQLFGYLPGQRQRGRVYPSFQLWDEVRGEPLERILRTLGDKPSGQDATFFAAINPDLLGSTPVEVLIGERMTDREDDEPARRLLALEPSRRLDAVLAAARKFTTAGA